MEMYNLLRHYAHRSSEGMQHQVVACGALFSAWTHVKA